MTIRLVDEGWRRELAEAVRMPTPVNFASSARSSKSALSKVYCLASPAMSKSSPGSTSPTLLKASATSRSCGRLLDINARVRGVRNLHAKLYLFGASRAIITSANLTGAALSRNHELGIVAEDAETIAACRTYFDNLWQHAGNDLRPDQVDAWDETVTGHRLRGGRPE